MENSRYFFDIHCHAFNLSHPNLLAFLKRLGINRILLYNTFFAPLINFFGKGKIEKILNLLSIMENSIGDYFLVIEYLLKSKDPVVAKNKITIGDSSYDRIILTPLMMDFYYQKIEPGNYFYNTLPQKPIVDQVIDLFNGIRKYISTELVASENGSKTGFDFINSNKKDKLFEIYPFMGLNTQNYTYNKLVELIEKYFSNYTGSHMDLYNNYGEFNGDIDDLSSNYFAGIKFYPPLGFDPWPIDPDEKRKVEFVYDVCCKKDIPITVHCSDGGFKVIKDKKTALRYTSPFEWEKVLKQYNSLRLNFAHLGSQSNRFGIFHNTKWQKKIIELVTKYENVFTDFSCLASKQKYYRKLRKILECEHNQIIKNKLLFGSDLMINLLWSNSYNEYLNLFVETPKLTNSEKELFCNINPRRFLFH